MADSLLSRLGTSLSIGPSCADGYAPTFTVALMSAGYSATRTGFESLSVAFRWAEEQAARFEAFVVS